MTGPHFRQLLAAAALAIAATAQAALPTVTLSFDQRTGTVGPGDSIDIFMTLTVDAGSAPLAFDGTTPAPFGFAAADLPLQGYYNDPGTYGNDPAAFASYTFVQTNTAYGCSGTFTSTCDPGAYAFTFHTSSEPGRPSFNFLPSLNLQPGESFSYLFGTFTPVGSVAPGTYSFYSAYTDLVFNGLDANGHDLYAYVDLGATCPTGAGDDCAFMRTVLAVPEVQTGALMVLGLLAIGGYARRRRRD
jgi:hypothetical protein